MTKKFKANIRVKEYLAEAEELSVVIRGKQVVTSDYLLLVVMEDENNELGKYLLARGIYVANYEEEFGICQELGNEFVKNFYEVKEVESKYSKEVEEVLSSAEELSKQKGLNEIDENSLIVCLLQAEKENSIMQILSDYVGKEIFYLKNIFSTDQYLNDNIGKYDIDIPIYPILDYSNLKEVDKNNEDDICSTMFELLNAKFKAHDPKVILGRDKEIEKVFITFQKMTTRNIILIGKPGVGKTAIVEGLTERIVKKLCPKEFYGKRVLSLDINGLLEDTMYLGQREEKFKALKEYLDKNEDVILFIDEIHNIIGAGRTIESSYDFANALKPILTNGKVRVIGATTHEEYNKYFAKDGALKRRFQTLEVTEPKSEELYKMLKGKLYKLKEYHEVEVSKEAFETVVAQASGYHFDIANPARTVDVLDTAMVIAKNHGKKELDTKSILEVHSENIKKFKKMNQKAKKATAYHEAGHYLVYKALNTKFKKVNLVSIIPSENYLGINVFEEKGTIGTRTKKEFINEIAEYLAGDMASNLKGYDKDSGKTNDIENASYIARNMVLSFGMQDGDENELLGTYSSYVENNTIITEYLSDRQKEELARQVDIILTEGYRIAENILKKKDKQLEIIAEALMQRGALNQSEIDGLYSGKLKIEDLPKSELSLIK